MDQEQPASGDAANRGHRNEAVESAALVASRRDDEGLRGLDDFVAEAAAGTTAVSGARSEDQRPRQASGDSGPGSGTGATTASAAAARVRQREDAKARDFREFDHFVKMHLQQQQTQTQTQQLITRLQQPPSRPSAEGGGEVAPGPASLDLELRL